MQNRRYNIGIRYLLIMVFICAAFFIGKTLGRKDAQKEIDELKYYLDNPISYKARAIDRELMGN